MNRHSVVYRQLQRGDEAAFAELVRLFNDAFDEPADRRPNEANIGKLLADERFVCFTADIGGKLVGGITAYELAMYDREGSALYLYDLAVDSGCRRQGIGSGLVKALIGYCDARGIRELFVQADADDRHAVAFYASLGGEPLNAVQFALPVPSRDGEKN